MPDDTKPDKTAPAPEEASASNIPTVSVELSAVELQFLIRFISQSPLSGTLDQLDQALLIAQTIRTKLIVTAQALQRQQQTRPASTKKGRK